MRILYRQQENQTRITVTDFYDALLVAAIDLIQKAPKTDEDVNELSVSVHKMANQIKWLTLSAMDSNLRISLYQTRATNTFI
jgi:hypothetical protein